MAIAVEWRKDKGEETLGIRYPLNSESMVVDIGGYRGDWVETIRNLYNPHIYVFEPVKEYYDIMCERFINRHKIYLYEKGLSEKSYTGRIVKNGDMSSILNVAGRTDTEEVFFQDIVEWHKESGLDEIDLIQINCEGMEYEILKRLIVSGLVKKFKNIKVQFHDIIYNAEDVRDKLRKSLRKTHRESYCYPFVWESWERI